jgi:hypothetical protein
MIYILMYVILKANKIKFSTLRFATRKYKY